MVRGTFSPARAWRPAVGPASAQPLGIRRATMWCSSRKCACRRESNSHNAARPRMPARRHAVARGRQSRRGNQQPDFSQGRRERRPVQTHVDAARGGDRMRQRASDEHVSVRMSGRRYPHRSSVLSTCKESRLRIQGVCPRCKAQSAMQNPWQAPQTRSTATAVAVARSGGHNGWHANTTLAACRAN